MLFFQAFLLVGYAYAHFVTRSFRVRTQFVVHVSLMTAALAFLPIAPDVDWKPIDSSNPTLRIVLLLAASIGLPYFVLSATGPLLQAWFSLTNPGRSPYRLYALSNAGSLLALVSYPFVVEPLFGVQTQAVIWSWLFGGFALSCAMTAAPLFRDSRETAGRSLSEAATSLKSSCPKWGETEINATVSSEPPTFSRGLLWFSLAMVPSVMLLAVTNQVCTDVAVFPFLWVFPLMLYLLSFILCFESDRWYSRRWFGGAWVILAAAVCGNNAVLGAVGQVSFIVQAVIYFSAMFCCCMVCHGELVQLKPDPRYLTSFYLVLAAGGAAGGLFVGLIAPFIFSMYVELHLALLGCSLLMLAVYFRDQTSKLYRGKPRWAWCVMVVGLTVLAFHLVAEIQLTVQNAYSISRNFYGVLRVEVRNKEHRGEEYFALIHGRTMHGMQFRRQDIQRRPTSYYGESSGVGIVLRNHRPGQPKRVGVVGLGVGTVAAYAKPDDWYCFYEINPEVIRLAREFFVYLLDCPADVQIVTGDARISLEQQSHQQFDVLILDAFSSDSIPVHLLTKEAIEVYLSHLQEDGILAVHTSNQHLDLQPVIVGLAAHANLYSVAVNSRGNKRQGTSDSRWNLLSRQKTSLAIDALRPVEVPLATSGILWTDTRSNIFQILRFWRE